MLRALTPIALAVPLLGGCAVGPSRAPACVTVPYANGVEHRVCDENGRLFIRATGTASRAESRRLLPDTLYRAVPILHPSGVGFLGPDRSSLAPEGPPAAAPVLRPRREWVAPSVGASPWPGARRSPAPCAERRVGAPCGGRLDPQSMADAMAALADGPL